MNRSAQFIPSLFAPPQRLNVWQWAEAHVVLSARVSPRPGPYRTDWCPYVREPQEAFTDPAVRFLILCWATRSSKTETGLNCVRYTIGEDPQPTMVVMPSKELARSFSETRFQPSIDDCPTLATEKPEDPDQFKLTEMHFKRCSVWLTGANSPANLKSRGVGVLYCDEIDTWKHQSAKETGALQQVLERIKDRPGAKAILTSTPTLESGQIWYEFQLGDMRYYYVPCPDCGEMQALKFERVRWPEDLKQSDDRWDLAQVKRQARYHCAKCDSPWNNSQKLGQLQRGEWRATNTSAEPDRRSYHLSSLYPAWIGYGEVACEFLRAKGNPEELQKVVNSWFAEPYYAYGSRSDFEKALTSKVDRRQVDGVPDGHKAICTVDVQQDHVRFVVRAHDVERNSVRLEYGHAPGLEEVEAVARRWGCVLVGVDARYRTQQVIVWCGTRPGWIPIIGAGGLMTPFRWVDMPVDAGLIKGRQAAVVHSLRVRPNDFKEELFRRISGQKARDKHLPPPKWSIAGDVGSDYRKEMAGEARQVRRGPRGTTIVEWIKIGPNHYWDCEVNQVVLWEAVRGYIFENAAQAPRRDRAPEDRKPPAVRSSVIDSELAEIQRRRDQNLPGSEQLHPIEENLWT